MKIRNGLLLLASGVILQACSGGGTGPLEVTERPFRTLVEVTGQANKGPFSQGAQVRSRLIAGDTLRTATTSGTLGDFRILMRDGEAGRIDVTGRYFSENLGVVSDNEATLSGIVSGDPNLRANINVATHMIHQRVLDLIESGIQPESAISMAESELMLAMADVVPFPANSIRFCDLSLLNAGRTDGNREGNAWLLAVSAIVEEMAMIRSRLPGGTAGSEANGLLSELTTAMADGQAFDQALLDEMIAARQALNPDRIHGYLLNLDENLRVSTMVVNMGLTRTRARQLGCDVSGEQIRCSEGGGMGGHVGMVEHMDLEDMVADMNRFVDTDGDGTVNADDDDDDNDGIPDSEDDTPYGETQN